MEVKPAAISGEVVNLHVQDHRRQVPHPLGAAQHHHGPHQVAGAGGRSPSRGHDAYTATTPNAC